MGQDGAALRAVDLAAGVVGGQPAEPVPIDNRSLAGRQAAQVRAVAGRTDPMSVRAPRRRPGERSSASLFCPAVEDHRHVGGPGGDPGRVADRLVAAAQLGDHVRELGDVGLVAGVGVPGQRDPAVPGDDEARPTSRRSLRFCSALPRCAMVPCRSPYR